MIWKPSRRKVIKVSAGAIAALGAREADATWLIKQRRVNPGGGSAAYVAQGLGVSVSWNMCTFALNAGLITKQPLANPVAVNTFAPTTASAATIVASWIASAVAAKAKYIQVTVKHRDGFCLWPSAYSTYTIAQTSWYGSSANDIVAQLNTQAAAAGLAVVMYWQPYVGTPAESLATCQNQLTELATNYGNVIAIWLDGPNLHGNGGFASPAPWPNFTALLSFIHGLPNSPILVANIHPGSYFNFSNTDILEYEGPSENVPLGNTNLSERINTSFTANSASYYFYENMLPRTTATAGTANTVTLPNNVTSNVFYAQGSVTIVSGTGAGQTIKIASYNGATKVFTMQSNWGTIPDTTSVCIVPPVPQTAANMQTNLVRCNTNAATFLPNLAPDVSGLVPADQAALFAAFGALH